MNIDILCFTGHKGLLGPQGTGGLCIHESVEIRHLNMAVPASILMKKGSHSLPARLEAGTLNSHGIAGLCAAINYINTITIPVIAKKNKSYYGIFIRGFAIFPKYIFTEILIQKKEPLFFL